ncbi:unnamed protein product, partial [marine sediment metagenome]
WKLNNKGERKMEYIPDVFWILIGAGFAAWGLSRLIRSFWGPS